MLSTFFNHLLPELARYRSHAIMLGMILGFACAHSGLAHLRPWGKLGWDPVCTAFFLRWSASAWLRCC